MGRDSIWVSGFETSSPKGWGGAVLSTRGVTCGVNSISQAANSIEASVIVETSLRGKSTFMAFSVEKMAATAILEWLLKYSKH